MQRTLATVLGIAALLATGAVLALNVVLALGLWTTTSPVRIAAVVASTFEAAVFIVLSIRLASCSWPFKGFEIRSSCGVWFAISLLTSVLASTASVIPLVLMSKTADLPKTILQVPVTSLLIGSSVALGFAFAAQLIFIVVHFVLHRLHGSDNAFSLHTNDDNRSLHAHKYVKSIPYSQTRVATFHPNMKERFSSSSEYATPPNSSGGRSGADPTSSVRSSFSYSVRPMGSRTRLLSNASRTRQRTASTDSDFHLERLSIPEEGFDSWDTSAVDPRNRQLVLNSSPPMRSGFLETIPASPTTSRSPSPGTPFDLEPPRPCRSRSYSPVSRPQHERTVSRQSSTDELHIHPLFRSDSPAPPAATPGTMVVAAPNAGQIIREKSLTRMRSSSLTAARKPLSREASSDSIHKASTIDSDRLRPEEPLEERKMTPPIPEWILSAGSRTSLTEYQSKRLRDRGMTT
ncbi:hypothetical protein F5X99DRAFT_221010 [Biscogniauxia marginata]|nr:hypothetical protein F5X99DRAFT_221010 [Biscogniauxia marginata]